MLKHKPEGMLNASTAAAGDLVACHKTEAKVREKGDRECHEEHSLL